MARVEFGQLGLVQVLKVLKLRQIFPVPRGHAFSILHLHPLGIPGVLLAKTRPLLGGLLSQCHPLRR